MQAATFNEWRTCINHANDCLETTNSWDVFEATIYINIVERKPYTNFINTVLVHVHVYVSDTIYYSPILLFKAGVFFMWKCDLCVILLLQHGKDGEREGGRSLKQDIVVSASSPWGLAALASHAITDQTVDSSFFPTLIYRLAHANKETVPYEETETYKAQS